MRQNFRLRAVACGLAIAGFAACSSTEIVTVKPEPLPLEGRWIVTTALDTFHYESGMSPPGCTFMYCDHYVADTSGRLTVTMTLAGDSIGAGGVRQYRLLSDSVTGSFCDAINYYVAPLGCTHVSPYPPTSYPVAKVTPSGGADVPSGLVDIVLTDSLRRKTVSLKGAYAGDSIRGRVYWTESFGRSPPSYTGVFTARRQ